jgi:hypothetical protein
MTARASQYVPRRDGEPILLGLRRQHLIACCDCGLVHKFKFKIEGGKRLSLRAWRLNRNTAQRRRWSHP